MHSATHFVTAFTLSYILVSKLVPLEVIIVWSLLFGVFVDLDIVLGSIYRSRKGFLRTCFQEPFGLLVGGLPLALASTYIFNNWAYSLLVLVPWGSHIVLDYLAVREVRPLLPFSEKKILVGFFRPILHKRSICPTNTCISEWWFLSFSIVIMFVVLAVL